MNVLDGLQMIYIIAGIALFAGPIMFLIGHYKVKRNRSGAVLRKLGATLSLFSFLFFTSLFFYYNFLR